MFNRNGTILEGILSNRSFPGVSEANIPDGPDRLSPMNTVNKPPNNEDPRETIHEIGYTLSVDVRPATPGWLSFRAGGRIDKNGRANFSLGRSEVEDLIEALKGWVMSTR